MWSIMHEGLVISPLYRSIDVRKMSVRKMKKQLQYSNTNDRLRHIDIRPSLNKYPV